jgi:hypothetical protein
MPVYELSLRKAHGELETRYTDIRPAVGDTVHIDGRPVRILSRHADPINETATARYACEFVALVSSEASVNDELNA